MPKWLHEAQVWLKGQLSYHSGLKIGLEKLLATALYIKYHRVPPAPSAPAIFMYTTANANARGGDYLDGIVEFANKLISIFGSLRSL